MKKQERETSPVFAFLGVNVGQGLAPAVMDLHFLLECGIMMLRHNFI